MAHEIETHGDKAAFVSAREHAWHRLGTVLPDTFTADQAMQVAHLGGWNVRKTPLQTVDVTDDGVTTVEVPDKFAMVRTNPFTSETDVLGVVGSQYTAIQNEEHAQFLDNIVDESGAHFETAGSLRDGREVFMTMRIPEHMKIGGVDPIDLYLVALNAHDGKQAFRLLITPVRVVCANTQAAALRNHRSSLAIRHTANARTTMEEAREALELSFGYADEFSVIAERMVNKSLSDEKYEKAVLKFFPKPDKLSDLQNRRRDDEINMLRHLWYDAPTLDDIRGTTWGAYQTFTEFLDHYRPVTRLNGRDEATARAERTIKPESGWVKNSAFAEFAITASK